MKQGLNSATRSAERKPQRIKMRLYKHPVKLDGTITEFAPDGSWFTVAFDGPLPETKFWKYGDTLVIDKEPEIRKDGRGEPYQKMAEGTAVWEVL